MADTDEYIVDLSAVAEIVTNARGDELALHYKVTRDMGQVAADAARDVARFQFAVPAQNRTYRVAIGAVATVVICWMAFERLTGEALGKVLVAAIVAIGTVFAVREYKRNKKD